MSVTFELTDRCRCCGSSQLVEVLDLGNQPPANCLRLPGEPKPGQVPLALAICNSCATCQLTATVAPSELFSEYVWVTGTASATRTFSEIFAREVLSRWLLLGGNRAGLPGLVVEVASNDGTFLAPFVEKGCQVLGVDPARNITTHAVANGIPTLCEFFSQSTVDNIRQENGAADIVIARNVIPHVANIHEVVSAIGQLLHEGGLAVVEFHYAGAILRDLQYDSIYHEHLFYFSIETLRSVFLSHGLHAFDVFESPLSGGAMVLLFSKEPCSPSKRLMAESCAESKSRLNSQEVWKSFGNHALSHSKALASMVSDHAEAGPVIGYGASARSSTLLNTAGISGNQLSVIIDRNEIKQGSLTPGSDLPIVSFEDGRAHLTDAKSVLLLAWNFESEIVEDLRREGFEGEVLVPLPGDPRVI